MSKTKASDLVERLAQYLEGRAADHEGDIPLIVTPAQRDLLVRGLRSSAQLAAVEARSASNADHARLANENQASMARALKASEGRLAAAEALLKIAREALEADKSFIKSWPNDGRAVRAHLDGINRTIRSLTEGDGK